MSAAKSIMFVFCRSWIFASRISASGYTFCIWMNSRRGKTKCRSRYLPSSDVRSYLAASEAAIVPDLGEAP